MNKYVRAFQLLSERRLLPFDQIDEDEARAELDRSLLVDVLGLDPALCEPGGLWNGYGVSSRQSHNAMRTNARALYSHVTARGALGGAERL